MNMKLSLNLDKTQKTIMLAALAVIACVFIFWLAVYNPARDKMRRLENEFTSVKAEIEKIEKASGGEENIDLAYEKLYKKFVALEERVSGEKTDILSALSSEADAMGIEVLAVRPEKTRDSRISMNIEGRSLSETPVLMNIRCDFKRLGMYLEFIKERINGLVNMESIDIKRAREDGQLDIWLNINVYFLQRPER
jgi:hypothetical protein